MLFYKLFAFLAKAVLGRDRKGLNLIRPLSVPRNSNIMPHRVALWLLPLLALWDPRLTTQYPWVIAVAACGISRLCNSPRKTGHAGGWVSLVIGSDWYLK
jgi:hypothetical protein